MTLLKTKIKLCSNIRLFTENHKAGKDEWLSQEHTS